MSDRIFHQAGHCTNWNLESLSESDVGDGIIFSPVHTSKDQLQSYPIDILKRSAFDPQFYLPRSQKAKLQSYDFFPDVISGGFDTTNFVSHALECAERCVDFQLANDFDFIVVPTRYINQMVSSFTDSQNSFAVEPFVHAINDRDLMGKKVFLCLVMTNHMVIDDGFRTNILNWATSFVEFDGVYLIADCERSDKQITDVQFLGKMIEMIQQLREVELDVLIGYTNSESILYSSATSAWQTLGTFENTRIFSTDKFVQSNEQRRGPEARIYVDSLMTSIRYGEAIEIRNANPTLWDEIFVSTEHSDDVFSKTVVPTFNQPALYKHHMERLSSQIQTVRQKKPPYLLSLVKSGLDAFEQISRSGFALDASGGNRHLVAWDTILKQI